MIADYCWCLMRDGKVLNPLENLKSESLFFKGDAILEAVLKVCYINDVLMTICTVYTAYNRLST